MIVFHHSLYKLLSLWELYSSLPWSNSSRLLLFTGSTVEQWMDGELGEIQDRQLYVLFSNCHILMMNDLLEYNYLIFLTEV